MTIVTLTVTGVAVFTQGFRSEKVISVPSIIVTSTTTGITMEGGGDINASSTNSDAWFGGHTTTTNLTSTNSTSTSLYSTNIGSSVFYSGSSTVTTLNFTNATGSILSLGGYLREGLYVTSRLGHANSPTVEYVGAGDGCQARITATSSSAPTYQATSTALCNP